MAHQTRLLLVATLLLALGASPAFAQNPFSIEGTVNDVSNSGVAPGATKTSDPNGNVKELGPKNASTTKIGVINTAPLPMLDTTNPNAQVDLNTVYTQSKVVGTDLWFYFGWIRDSNSGSGFISIELERNAPPVACAYGTMTEAQLIAGCNPWAGRSDGDAIILWDQSGSSTALTYRIYSAALGAFSAPVTIPGTIGTAVYGPDGFRGEAAVNISALVSTQTNQCLTFANIIPGTVTGNSDSADYKDTVLSRFPLASNCGIVTVTKVTQNGAGTAFTTTGSEGPFPFTLTAGTLPIFGSAADADCTTSGASLNTCQADLAKGGSSASIENLLGKTTYTLVEGTIADKWEKVSIVCGGVTLTTPTSTFTVTAGQTTACTITNKLKQGTLIVKKIVNNTHGGTKVSSDFTLDIHVSLVPAFAGSSTGTEFKLNDGVTYGVDEGSVTGYHQSGATADCIGTIVANTTKECTITNDDIAPILHLVKVVENNAGGTAQPSAFTLTATGPTTLTGAAPQNSGAGFSAGTYTLSESTVAGYSLKTDWSCTPVVNSGTSITLGVGQETTCTIVNQDAKATPTGLTTQRVRLFDKLAITGIRTGAATPGTVTFSVYSNVTCTTQVATQSGIAITLSNQQNGTADGLAETTVAVESTGVGTQPKTFYWIAQYTGDLRNNGFTRPCGKETTTINIADDPGGN